MKSTLRSEMLVLALLWVASGPAQALSTDKDQPLDLEADSAEIDEAKGQSTYLGNVVASQGSMRLESDRLTLFHKDSKAERLEAVGKPARFQQVPDGATEPVRARAQRMEYRFDSEELLLTGDATVVQGRDTFKSDRITYDRVRSVVKGGAAAQGKERVRITVDPKARERARDDKKPATSADKKPAAGTDRKTPAPEKKPPATDKKKQN
jgi:lipopolysaccharide export system protein LptA